MSDILLIIFLAAGAIVSFYLGVGMLMVANQYPADELSLDWSHYAVMVLLLLLSSVLAFFACQIASDSTAFFFAIFG